MYFLDVQPFTSVSPQDSESPGEQLLCQHLMQLVTSGDKCVVISSKKKYFEQKSITLMDSTEFLFHFDCSKDAMKKQSNLLVQRGWEKQKFVFCVCLF